MTDQTANLAQAMRDANTGEAWAAEQGIPFGHFAQIAVDQLVAAGWQPPEDYPSDADAVQNLLDDATRAFAAAGTSSERVEVIRDLLAGWYAAWPPTAVTDEHEGIAHQIVALVHAAEARAGEALGSVSPRAQGPRPGQFCTKHFSWLCQAGQGQCQASTETTEP